MDQVRMNVPNAHAGIYEDTSAIYTAVTAIRTKYELAGQAEKSAIIQQLYLMDWNPTVGFVADVVGDSRMNVSRTTRGIVR